ncbi:hypothetical protein [Humibacillus sp. DSM 29435]|uniref:hypothetical protein n=1 Tax=Humibacillus sp. DSM 29435 TaxID=1869167 RepID=UPI00111306E4|nr:hypothetical protein [Humibacillus sp. DSM 29435]
MSQAVQDPQMVEHLVDQLGYRAGMDAVYDCDENPNVIGSEFVDPMVEDPAGPMVVREVLNKLRREAGVQPDRRGRRPTDGWL